MRKINLFSMVIFIGLGAFLLISCSKTTRNPESKLTVVQDNSYSQPGNNYYQELPDQFPEPSRILALKGAEIIFCPIWGDVRGKDIWKLIARARAVDNSIYFITSIYDGHSLIVNPAGEVLQESDSTKMLLTETIDLNYSPRWNWIGNPGLGEWRGVWRKDRRSDTFDALSNYESTYNSLPSNANSQSNGNLNNKKISGINPTKKRSAKRDR